MDPAPIAFFVYNRLDHARRAVEALQQNELAGSSALFVFSDGPRTAADEEKVQSVRTYVRSVTGFREVTVVERERNLGCARSISGGVTEIVNRFGRVVVVEDDIVTAPYFLRYMNEALSLYQDDEEVASIHAYLYPVDVRLPETFFIRGAEIWGWATWKRAWDVFDFDAQRLLRELESRGLTRAFDFDGSARFTDLLRAQIEGRIDTWDVQWHAAAFLRGMLTLYPGRSMARNIGFDDSGTHNRTSRRFEVVLSEEPVRLERIPFVEDERARAAFARFWRGVTPGFWKRALIGALGLTKRIPLARRSPR